MGGRGVQHAESRWNKYVNNQQDATTFSFNNLFNSAVHVLGDKFAHPQEHFLTIYSFWYNAPTLLPIDATIEMEFLLNRGTGRQRCRCNVPKAAYRVKKCSWGWVNLSPETCRADLKRRSISTVAPIGSSVGALYQKLYIQSKSAPEDGWICRPKHVGLN